MDGHLYSCKELAEYMNLMPYSQHDEIETFYRTANPNKEKWSEFLQQLDKFLYGYSQSCTFPIT